MLLLVGSLLAAPVDIPAGSFKLGSGRAPDESPVRAISLAAYRIDATEVTLAEFERFVAAGGYRDPRWWSDGANAWLRAHPEGAGTQLRASGRPGEHPVVAVTWFEADAYCHWAGGSLPSEAQWEHAACGAGGRRYPWGDAEDFDAVWYKEGKYGQLTGVRTAPADLEAPTVRSPFGLVHAAGNVWEWTADTYDAGWYAQAPAEAPLNTAPHPWRTLRGGSFMNLPSYCTCTHREPAAPDDVRLTTGFRCAYPAP